MRRSRSPWFVQLLPLHEPDTSKLYHRCIPSWNFQKRFDFYYLLKRHFLKSLNINVKVIKKIHFFFYIFHKNYLLYDFSPVWYFSPFISESKLRKYLGTFEWVISTSQILEMKNVYFSQLQFEMRFHISFVIFGVTSYFIE